ncbi:ABC transporter permease subunit [Clostridium sp. WB02_MRS01]|uniref:ABC transporter permease subunit n=1 Tax=Clostridium sp. WB02_MRS01 TaxID=2605777 RepID=UPI0012B385E4|nr:ABC transporter permease subunit [Clostridium sp. WB02_MRS01]MSS11324.1 ABC transporter permease subunit [Clostridium sp. WB02_MRS01]
MFLALCGVAIPNFWLALMLVLVFAVNLGWLSPMGIDQGLRSYILPAISGCMGALASCARQTRSSMLAVIRADYIIPYDYTAMDMTSTFAGPSLKHFFGCDDMGRDIFSR